MKKTVLFRLALLCMTAAAIQNARAASTVATDGHGHLVRSYGQPTKEIAVRHALDGARLLYGPQVHVRLIAASDKTGFGAIAVAARKGGGSLVGVALAKRSQAEADALAIDHCLKAGGVNPKVRWEWRG